MSNTLLRSLYECRDTPLIERVIQWESWSELMLSLPNLIVNVYFIFRFNRIAVFHPNLKVLMLSTNFGAICISSLHPIFLLIPTQWYSIERGSYVTAFFVYSMVYANSVAVLFVSFKFFVFGLERKWAMNKRHSYEIYDGSLAKQLVLRTVLLLCMVVVVKIVVLFYRSTASSVDQRLTESFLFECHPLVAFPLTAIAGISLVFGVYEFYRVQHFVKQNRHDARSLTESFLFRETQSVLEVMNPLVFAYFLLASTSALVTGFAISLLHYGDCNVHSSTYRIFINASYLAVSVYGLFASLFMIFKFAAVRRLFYHDFYKLTGRRLLSNRTSVVPYNMDAIQVQSHYFADLNRAWN